MDKLASFRTKLPSLRSLFLSLFLHLHSFWSQLAYYIIVSLVGYLALKVSKPKAASMRLKEIDIFFTSVSAATVSSMSTVEMEAFSDTQLIILTVLMLVGGEVFTSLLGLLLRFLFGGGVSCDIELSSVTHRTSSENTDLPVITVDVQDNEGNDNLKYGTYKYLCYVVLGYLLITHLGFSGLVALYISLTSTAREVLNQKNLRLQTFSIFIVVSSFANCGFVPTNENMIVFKKNSGLLLLLVPQILLGNTLYAPSLRFLIWVLEKITNREELRYILKDIREMDYDHLLSSFYSVLLVVTVLGFILVQFVVFCCMEWNSEIMAGLNWKEKMVAALFEVVNSRHAGESVFDLSSISPAILALFVVMMYLPPYTSFLPIEHQEKEDSSKRKGNGTKRRKTLVQNLLFSQLSYIALFVILICITERDNMENDPLNFNVLNAAIEVISAYGNVGFSTGYSCKRQIKKESSCTDAWYGFAGKWSNMGKFLLIVVMFFGRLKKFNMKGGKAWKLA